MRKEQTGGGGGDPGQWDQIAGVVDDAVARLRPGDRDALILRYFQNRSFEQIGVTTGVSADAARKRVSRAMAQLRDWFARRGIHTSGQALGSMLLAHALAPAPAGISAAQIAQAALGGAEIGAAGAKGAVILMTTTTAKIAAAAVIAVLGIGVPVVYLHVRTTRAAAPQASTARGGDWQSEFRRVYALVPGQMLKRIGAPSIPARRDFARQ